MNALSTQDRAALLDFLINHFNLSELKNLAFSLNVHYELFAHDTLPDLARELLQFCERREIVNCLLQEIRRLRPDRADWLAALLAQMPPCDAGQKVQIIVAETLLEQTDLFLKELAQTLSIPAEKITIIGAAWGSMYLLLAIPAAAMDFSRFKHISVLGNGRYHILSIEAFAFLPPNGQKTWQTIATTYPPVNVDNTLYATVSWQVGQSPADKQNIPAVASMTASSPPHWSSREDNQTRLWRISQGLVSKLSPAETERLNSLFPQYVALAQTGQVKTSRQAQTAFGLGGADASLALVVLSVLFTTINFWLGQQNRQTLTELKLRQESDRALLDRLIDKALKEQQIGKSERARLRPYLTEAVAREIGDPYTPYERGLAKLTEQIGHNLELLTYEQQLRENIRQTRQHGDTPARAARRSEILEQLNRFALHRLGQPFNNLCWAAGSEAN